MAGRLPGLGPLKKSTGKRRRRRSFCPEQDGTCLDVVVCIQAGRGCPGSGGQWVELWCLGFIAQVPVHHLGAEQAEREKWRNLAEPRPRSAENEQSSELGRAKHQLADP